MRRACEISGEMECPEGRRYRVAKSARLPRAQWGDSGATVSKNVRMGWGIREGWWQCDMRLDMLPWTSETSKSETTLKN